MGFSTLFVPPTAWHKVLKTYHGLSCIRVAPNQRFFTHGGTSKRPSPTGGELKPYYNDTSTKMLAYRRTIA